MISSQNMKIFYALTFIFESVTNFYYSLITSNLRFFLFIKVFIGTCVEFSKEVVTDYTQWGDLNRTFNRKRWCVLDVRWKS